VEQAIEHPLQVVADAKALRVETNLVEVGMLHEVMFPRAGIGVFRILLILEVEEGVKHDRD